MSFGGGSVMVWGWITGRRSRTPSAQRCIDDILRPTVLPFLQQEPRGDIDQHDNARLHTDRIVQNFLEPTTSACCRGLHARQTCPPIEHMSDVMDHRDRQHPHPLVNQLIQALQRECLRVLVQEVVARAINLIFH